MKSSSIRYAVLAGHLVVCALTLVCAVIARTVSFDNQRLSTLSAAWAGAAVLSSLIYIPAALYVWRARKRPNGVDGASGKIITAAWLALCSLAVALTAIGHISLRCTESDCTTTWPIVTIIFGFVGLITSATWLAVDLLAVRTAKQRRAATVWKESMWALMEENEAVGKRYSLTPMASDYQ